MNLREYSGVFRVNINHWLEFKVLGMPHSLVLAGWVGSYLERGSCRFTKDFMIFLSQRAQGLDSPGKVNEGEALLDRGDFHFVLCSEKLSRQVGCSLNQQVSQQDSHKTFQSHSDDLLLKLDNPLAFKRIPVAFTTGTFLGFGVVVLHCFLVSQGGETVAIGFLYYVLQFPLCALFGELSMLYSYSNISAN